MREIDKLGMKYKMHEEDEVFEAPEEALNSGERRAAIDRLDGEAMAQEREEKKELFALPGDDEDPNFSASFYGPVFDDEPQDIVPDEEEEVSHGYILVEKDPPHKYKFKNDLYSKMIRYFLFTFQD
jgi:hypothetical protein